MKFNRFLSIFIQKVIDFVHYIIFLENYIKKVIIYMRFEDCFFIKSIVEIIIKFIISFVSINLIKFFYGICLIRFNILYLVSVLNVKTLFNLENLL